MRPNTLVASTMRSRRPPPWAIQRPTICSVTPSPVFPSVDIGGVEKVDPLLEGAVHDCKTVALGGQWPEVHRAQTQATDLQTGAAQSDMVHTASCRCNGI